MDEVYLLLLIMTPPLLSPLIGGRLDPNSRRRYDGGQSGSVIQPHFGKHGCSILFPDVSQSVSQSGVAGVAGVITADCLRSPLHH